MEEEFTQLEILSYKGLLMRAIEQCRVAIAHQSIKSDSQSADSPVYDVAYAVKALYLILQNHGEKKVRSEAWAYRRKVFNEMRKEYPDGWRIVEHISIYHDLFDEVMLILNKYDMLFDELPKGYSNVEIKSVSKKEYATKLKEKNDKIEAKKVTKAKEKAEQIEKLRKQKEEKLRAEKEEERLKREEERKRIKEEKAKRLLIEQKAKVKPIKKDICDKCKKEFPLTSLKEHDYKDGYILLCPECLQQMLIAGLI